MSLKNHAHITTGNGLFRFGYLLGLAIFLATAGGQLCGQEGRSLGKSDDSSPPKSAEVPPDADLAVDPELASDLEMARKIDFRINEKLERSGWEKASLTTDASFLRRAWLDLAGTNPPSIEVLDYLKDSNAQKRTLLVQKLVRSPAFSNRMAAIWTDLLLPDQSSPEQAVGRTAITEWLRERFEENLRYDRMIGDLLVAEGSSRQGPVLFFTSMELKPEKLAARTSRAFLGIQLDCAECHDHPFDQWKQKDFWKFAAYFAQLQTEGNMMDPGNTGNLVDVSEGDVKLPGSEEIIPPSPLVGVQASSLEQGTRRQKLALWFASRDNPYLAKAAVNRVWWILMGRGLVEPVDDMSPHQSPSHPELLDELTNHFVKSGFDLRRLISTIAMSECYARSTIHPGGIAPAELYATMPIKPLEASQLQNVLRSISGQLAPSQPPGVPSPMATLVEQLGKLRGEGNGYDAGVIQALMTLHGESFGTASGEESSRLVNALQAPFLSPQQQIDQLFLVTLARKPTESEKQAIQNSFPANGDEAEKRRWQSDLLWALINSTEFAMTP